MLVPGGGGSAWDWHLVVPLLESAGMHAVAVDLPAGDDTADLLTYADVVRRAARDSPRPLILVAHSMGAYTAPIAATGLDPELLVLLNPMVPAPGESARQWWEATGQPAAMAAHFERLGFGARAFDPDEDFYHDVPEAVRAEAASAPEPEQSDTPFEQPWPLDRWPDVPIRVLTGRDDRLFPLEFQRRLARERLGLDIEEMPGGHMVALSRPEELAGRLLGMLPS
ncbi:alpha/beta hydrolase [Mycobacterium sp. NPDC050551]|uniref:alpha/beta fold hydrolase n=1 Tax=Mycobacterium sp. NPDC050551 TaxID=3155407 RepID=UPI0034481D11